MNGIRSVWSDDLHDQLCSMAMRGMTMLHIANAMGRTRSAISGQIMRLREANDPRLAGYEQAAQSNLANGARFRNTPGRRLINALAELLSEDLSLKTAARYLSISETHAETLFGRICDELGPQAV